MSFEQQHCLEVRREHSFVVDRATTVHVSVLDFGGERIDGPVLAFDTNDVHVSHENHGTTRAVAAKARDESSAAGRRLEQLRLDRMGLEDAREILRDRKLVTGRIHGVDLDHPLQMLDGLAGHSGPVDRGYAGR